MDRQTTLTDILTQDKPIDSQTYNLLHTKITQIINEHFKIVGCGNCQNYTNNRQYCQTCSMNTGSGSFWHVNKQYASSLATSILEIELEEGSE